MRKKSKRKHPTLFPQLNSDSFDAPFVIGIKELNHISDLATKAYIDDAQFNYLNENRLLQVALTLHGLKSLLSRHQVAPPYELDLKIPAGKEISEKK